MQLVHCALALLITMIWGFNFVLIKASLTEISPIFLSCIRFFLTSIPVVFFVRRPTAPFTLVALYGLVMFAVQFALLFSGMKLGVTPALASILLQVQVFFIAILSIAVFKEKITFWQVLGALISFLGIYVVGVNIEGSITLWGLICVIGAAACWAVGSLVSKKMGDVNMLGLVVWGSLVAWPPLLMVTWYLYGFDRMWLDLSRVRWEIGGSILYLTYLSTLFCYFIWSWLLKKYSLATVGPFTLLTPIFALLSSILMCDEPIQSWKITAIALVLSGLVINIIGQRIKKSSASKPES